VCTIAESIFCPAQATKMPKKSTIELRAHSVMAEVGTDPPSDGYEDNIFTKLITGDIPSSRLFEDDKVRLTQQLTYKG
jgi:hypothetical protein